MGGALDSVGNGPKLATLVISNTIVASSIENVVHESKTIDFEPVLTE